MNHEYQERPKTHDWMKLFRNLLMMSTGGALLTALILLMGFWRTGGRFLESVAAIFNPPQPAPVVDIRSIVIHQVRSASDLTTAVFAMEAVVPTSQNTEIGGFVLGTTKLLYIAYGEVRAGVDLSQLTVANIDVKDDTIRIQLPPPQILDSKIDVQRSNVYDYNRGFLGLGPDVAPELLSLAEKKSLEKVVAAACDKGLLEEANQRAELVVSKLLNTAGYKTVSVTVQPPAPNACASPPTVR